MRVEIEKGVANGKVKVVPSKSYAHRLLLASALSRSSCTVSNVKFNNDVKATLNCIESLGIDFALESSSVKFLGVKKDGKTEYDCIESGSTLRFIIPIALALNDSATFVGTKRLIERGIGIYEDILKGTVKFTKNEDSITANGRLKSGFYKIKGNVSSQFITGMMFALPLCEGDSVIKIISPFESKGYVDITLDVLRKFGINIKKLGNKKFKIYGNQKYKAIDSEVEGDWSNGAFMYALNALGGSVKIEGTEETSLQGDKKCLEIFKKLERGYARINLKNTPDLAPVAFAVASAKFGAKFVETKRLKIKESDRASVMQTELEKFGVKVKVRKNSVIVKGGLLKPPTQTLLGHNDHRIVMALSVLLTLTGGSIDGAEAVNKSYKEFFIDLKLLGIGVKESA